MEMNKKKKLNWGILGTGLIAREMGAALQAVNGEIYAVCGSSVASAENYAKEFGVTKAYGDADELIRDEQVDIIYIATPHNLHYKFLLQSVKAGKHVFSEKSITVNSRQLEECVAIAKEKDLVICDGITLLHMPLYKKLRQLVEDGAIGDVKMVQVNFGSCKEYDIKNRFFSKDLSGGALLDIGVYAVAFARYFMKSNPNVVLTTANYFETGVDETSGILLKNSEGEMAVIALTMRAKQPKRGVIAGEKGFIEISDYPRAAKATITYTEDGHTELVEAGNTQEALQYEVADMQEYVLHHGGEENLRMVRDVMETLSTIRNQWGLKYPEE